MNQDELKLKIQQARAQGVPDEVTFKYLNDRGLIPKEKVVMTSQTTQPAQETTVDSFRQKPTMDAVKNSIGGKIISAMTSSERNLGETIGQTIAVNSKPTDEMISSQQNLSDIELQTIKRINEKKAIGEDTTRLQSLLNRIQGNTNITPTIKDIAPASQKSTGEVIGEIGGTTLDLLTAGTYKSAQAGIKSFELATKSKLVPTVVEKGVELLKNPKAIFTVDGLKKFSKVAAAGTGIGYGYDITQGLQGDRGEDRTGVNALIPGLNTVLGFGIPTVIEATGKVRNLFNAEKYLNDVKTDWQKTGTDFVKSSKVLSKAEQRGKDPISMLSERGITPQSVVENGKFNTVEISDKIRTQDTAPFEDVLQRGLKEADMGNTKIPIEDIKKTAINNINSDNTLTLGQKKNLIEKVNDETLLMAEHYKDGISRVDANNEKRIFWQNTKFDKSNLLERDFYYQVGKALKESIEKYTPDINIAGINSYLGDLYESARFLDTLNGKVPKITTGQKINRAITKSITTFVGAHLGGGLPGGAAGYIVGNSVSHALESMSNPLKSYFIRKLEVSNPEAYNQALRYLGNKEVERLSRLRLEAPSKLGTTKNPIITPAPTTYEKQSQNIAPTRTYNPVDKKYYEKGKIGGGINS